MSTRYDKLKTLLEELFQLDQPDLDFGFYRVMHARANEVKHFLDEELLLQIKAAFAQYQSADKAEINKELAKVIAGVKAGGMDPEDSPTVKELRAKLADDSVDLDALEAEVYDHLYSFFRRYYSEGDFLSKRVYKSGVYAIPYEGEEVKLHWANADQYYIKTSEYLRDYAFRLRPGDEKNPMRVHFRLVDAAEGEHGNVKEQAGKERRFKLAPAPFAAVKDGELVIRFTYEPDPTKQKDLNAAAEAAILGLPDAIFADWVRALWAKHVRADGTASDATRLSVHLDRYTARNTFDYFIHKDLGRFLKRELDFYIKNEVMHLDDVEKESVPRVEQYLSKIKVIRRIAGKIIEFLAQLEDFQKKLWLKKKFVVETSYCIRLSVIPEELFSAITENEAQREEWVRLCAIDELKKTDGSLPEMGPLDYSVPLTVEFLKAHPSLLVDTRHFDPALSAQIIEAVGNLDDLVHGVLVNSENSQALSLLQSRHREQIKCVYIDPPYNTEANAILYKNTYRHSSWLSLMSSRLSLSRHLEMPHTGVHIIAIDETELSRVSLLLKELFQDRDLTTVSVIHNPGGTMGKNFSNNGEFALFVHDGRMYVIQQEDRSESPDIRDLMNTAKGSAGNHLRETGKTCFYPILVENMEIIGFGEVCGDDFHPNQNEIRQDGVIEVYPIDADKTERKWVLGRDTILSAKSELRAKIDPKTNFIRIERCKSNINYKTVWTDNRYSAKKYGTEALGNIITETREMSRLYPKSYHLVRDCIRAGTKDSLAAYVLDYFAGSGTTGHAVINLNREDGGQRRFILVEQADYFDTVLLPRLKKVVYSPEWKNGKPKRLATAEEAERSPRIMKVLRLESYEDTLNNLELHRTKEQQGLLDLAQAQGSDKLKEQYMLRYLLDVETRGSQSLLNVAAFTDPTAYKLKVKLPGSDESREVNVDLLETFNWLIGLTVQHINTPRTFSASFKLDDDKDLPEDAPRRLLLDGRLKEDPNGSWWFRTVSGMTPDGRKTLVIWRKRPGSEMADGIVQDNLVLNEWFKKLGYSSRDSEFDLIYVNGDNNLENLKASDDNWKVRLIEEDFFRLMFETEGD